MRILFFICIVSLLPSCICENIKKVEKLKRQRTFLNQDLDSLELVIKDLKGKTSELSTALSESNSALSRSIKQQEKLISIDRLSEKSYREGLGQSFELGFLKCANKINSPNWKGLRKEIEIGKSDLSNSIVGF